MADGMKAASFVGKLGMERKNMVNNVRQDKKMPFLCILSQFFICFGFLISFGTMPDMKYRIVLGFFMLLGLMIGGLLIGRTRKVDTAVILVSSIAAILILFLVEGRRDKSFCFATFFSCIGLLLSVANWRSSKLFARRNLVVWQAIVLAVALMLLFLFNMSTSSSTIRRALLVFSVCSAALILLLHAELHRFYEAKREGFKATIARMRGRFPESGKWNIVLLIAILAATVSIFSNTMITDFIAGGSLVGHDAFDSQAILLFSGIGFLLAGGAQYWKGPLFQLILSCFLTIVSEVFLIVYSGSIYSGWVFAIYLIGHSGITLFVLSIPCIALSYISSPYKSIMGVIFYSLTYAGSSFFNWVFRFNGGIVEALGLDTLLVLVLLVSSVWLWMGYQLQRQGKRLNEARNIIKLLRGGNSEPANLTNREREVMKLLMERRDRSEIAEILDISFSTVNKHVVSIYKKADCSSHIELLAKYTKIY